MYLGIDIGTSSVKAVLAAEAAGIRVSRSMPLGISRPHPGWSEQDPEAWFAAVLDVMAALQRDDPAALAAVKAIGLSGQMHGATLLDQADRVLRPAILWNDGRAATEAASLDNAARRYTGNLAFPGFTAPKLLWVAAHEPDVFARVRSVLLPKDYVRFRLTGEKVSEPSDASGTLWLDIARRDWSDPMLALTRLDRRAMPRLVEGTEVSGTLLPELASRFGMGKTVLVAGGAGDNAAAAVGVGAVRPGTGFLSLGTSGVIFVTAARFEPNPASAVHAFCHAVPQIWHQMGVTLAAAGALDWLARFLGDEPEVLTRALPDIAGRPGAIQFLPYLSGERTPHNDVAARGALVGLDLDSDRAAVTRAVIEGVSFAFRDCFEAITVPLAEPPRLIAVGGGSRSSYWLSVLAQLLGVTIELPVAGDFGAAFGAARLAMIAAEKADPFQLCAMPDAARSFAPDPDLEGEWQAAYQRWRRLYPSLKGASLP